MKIQIPHFLLLTPLFAIDPMSSDLCNAGVARLRVSLSLAFYAEARLRSRCIMSEAQMQLVYAPSGLIGLPGRRKTAYQVT